MPELPTIHFIHPRAEQWREWVSREPLRSPHDEPQRFRSARDHATSQIFVHLLRRGHDVRISEHFVPGEVCVVHTDDLALREPLYDSFIVVIQNDRCSPKVGNLCVTCSRRSLRRSRDHFMPFYAQTGLLPRDPARGTRIERLAFMGIAENLAAEFAGDAFRTKLARRGVELRIEQRDWHNYRDVDLVLAVRTHYVERFLRHKPPVKLINAWRAGVPALLGPEPSFRDLRRTDLDYIEITRPEDALAAIDRLQQDPQTYAAMVENALSRGAAHSDEAVNQAWEALFAGPVATRYRRWLATRGRVARAVRKLCYRWQAARHWRARRRWDDMSWWRLPGTGGASSSA